MNDDYPRLDGDEGDMVLYRMEWRMRTIFCMAAAELELDSDDVVDSGFATDHLLAHAVEALYDDWQQFRRDLIREVRRSAEAGHIQRKASGEVVR